MKKTILSLGLSFSICLCTYGCGQDKNSEGNHKNFSPSTNSFTETSVITTENLTAIVSTSTTVSLSTTTKEITTTTTKHTTSPTTTTSTTTQPPTTTVNIPPKETYAFYGVVATESGNLNLRNSPSVDSNIIKELPKGTKGSIYYIEGTLDWYKIYTDDGLSGYVSAQYIKEYKETDYSQGDNNGESSYIPPKEVDISLNISTPIEFSKYSDDTLISTIRLDKVEYNLKLENPSKSYDSEPDKYYISLKFYLTKTYDRYANEQRYSTNPSIFFNIEDLTTGKKWQTSKAGYIELISAWHLNRVGDTDTDTWSDESYKSRLILDSSHKYIINIWCGNY